MRSYSNFPSQVVSDSEKLSPEYGLKVAQAIELEWFDDSGYNNRYLKITSKCLNKNMFHWYNNFSLKNTKYNYLEI